MSYKVVLGKGKDTKRPVQMYCLESEKLETENEVVLLEKIPEPEIKDKKMSIPYYNKIDSVFFYEYVDRELSHEEQQLVEIEELKQENYDLKMAMAELAEQQTQSNYETNMAIAELAELVIGGVE